jgi:SulP family sulfate permease
MVAPLFGGFAATGAIARTATNIRNGGTSPLAGIFHALTLIAVLLILAPLASSIPLAALAAILFVVAWNMSEVHRFTHILKTAPTADRSILVITFLLTVFADLVVAVNVGVILAILHFLRRMAESVETQALDASTVETELTRHGIEALPAGVMVYEIAGPMFFGSIENFERALLHTHSDPKALIVRLRHVPFVDFTGIDSLQDAYETLRRRGVRVVLCEANERVLKKLRKAGMIDPRDPERYHASFPDAVRHVLSD